MPNECPQVFVLGIRCAGGCPAASYFLLLRQKKVTKEKATRVRRSGKRRRTSLRCSRRRADFANSLRSDSEARRPPPPLRCSAALTGKKSVAARPVAEILYGRCAPTPPVRAAEQRRAVGGSRRALSEPEGRVAQPPDRSSSAGQLSGSLIAGQPANPGRLLLVTFLGETRKVTGCRATPARRIRTQYRQSIHRITPFPSSPDRGGVREASACGPHGLALSGVPCLRASIHTADRGSSPQTANP